MNSQNQEATATQSPVVGTAKQREQAEAADTLRELLPPGTTVYTVLRHVSRSGMSRDIDLYVMQDGEPRWISRLAARAAGLTFNERAEAVRMGGCGMDMGFAAVYALSHALYPDGFECVGETIRESDSFVVGCPSNDHSNGDRDYSPHHHASGGYALRHRWM